jgi:hypothetical protein
VLQNGYLVLWNSQMNAAAVSDRGRSRSNFRSHFELYRTGTTTGPRTGTVSGLISLIILVYEWHVCPVLSL